ncbi:hypothetical protein EU538_12130 [Candidatus Thorarchaeota archaeon]|nr:MAG: hypothetical protein EU538_12130 [Candidatus Thorarchaeota archaeon]
MVRGWFHIAKAEFFVLTAGMRKHRYIYSGILYALALLWAVYLAPMIVVGLIDLIIPMAQLQGLLVIMLPGTMRTVMFFAWVLLLLFPLSYALNELKIGHWEIFLSNDVKTKDILVGTLMGKMPFYTLIVLMLAPLLMSPFLCALQVSLVGQVFVYLALTGMVLTVIWLSNWITALVQARLGDSSRGNDLAKAIGMIVAVVVIVPMYGIIYMLPAISEFLGMDAFLLFPSTWTADLISWLAITFNGVGLTGSQVIGFQTILHMDMVTNALLMTAFGVVSLAVALGTADRIFTISAGSRTEVITTVKAENAVIRGIRRLLPSATGVLLVSNLKDYLRKAQNLSKLAYGVVLAVLLPVFLSFVGSDAWQTMDEMTFFVVMMMAVVGSMPFAGQGFLESKDQLWIIQGAADGPSRFVKTRLVSSLLVVSPLIVIPAVVIGYLMHATLIEFLVVLGLGYLGLAGGTMVSIGVTARNPNYEDTKSPAHQTNMMLSVMIPQFSIMIWLFVDLFADMLFGIDVFGFYRSVFPSVSPFTIIGIQGVIGLLIIGGLLLLSGIRSLSKPEN